MDTPKNRTGGWSCVELVASICLLVFGLLSLAVGFYGSSNLAEKSRQNNLMSLTYRNVVAELEASDLASLETLHGTTSGNDQFWCGDNNVDACREQRVFYDAPLKPFLSGSIRLLTDETALPATWSGFGSGLDMNCDGVLEVVTSLATKTVGTLVTVVGSLLGGGGTSGSSGTTITSPLKILPAEISLSMDGFDGQRTLDAYVILAK